MNHLLNLFLHPFVHLFSSTGSNFTKNPFCYFRICSLISHSPKNPIICQSV